MARAMTSRWRPSNRPTAMGGSPSRMLRSRISRSTSSSGRKTSSAQRASAGSPWPNPLFSSECVSGMARTVLRLRRDVSPRSLAISAAQRLLAALALLLFEPPLFRRTRRLRRTPRWWAPGSARQLLAQPRERDAEVLRPRSFVLPFDRHPRRKMDQPNGRLGLVAVLASGTARAMGLDVALREQRVVRQQVPAARLQGRHLGHLVLGRRLDLAREPQVAVGNAALVVAGE